MEKRSTEEQEAIGKQAVIGEQKTIGEQNNKGEKEHIGELDGIRAAAALGVMAFHLWQQNWLTPPLRLPAVAVRTGFLYVDLLVLLSAFCNFLPCALGQKPERMGRYLGRRAARILPSFYLAVLISWGIAWHNHAYDWDGAAFAWKDLLAHLSCAAVWIPGFFQRTKINFAVWTVEMELCFYPLIHLAARFAAGTGADRAKGAGRTALSVLCLTVAGAGAGLCIWFASRHSQDIAAYVNYPLTFPGVYASGILCCMAYARLRERGGKRAGAAWTLLLILAGYGIFRVQSRVDAAEQMQLMQLRLRPLLSVFFAVLLLAALLGSRWIRRLLSMRIFRWICVISYNLYLWHQPIFVWLKQARIPWYAGEIPPNQTGDVRWQWQYTGIALLGAFGAAAALTFLAERPAEHRLRNALCPKDSQKHRGETIDASKKVG